jgi:hypothetical protein
MRTIVTDSFPVCSIYNDGSRCQTNRSQGVRFIFCAVRLLEQTRGKGVPPPAILGLLPFGLLLKQALLLTRPTHQKALLLADIWR